MEYIVYNKRISFIKNEKNGKPDAPRTAKNVLA